MTIYADSRYADGTIFKAYDSRYQDYYYTVFREFPISTVRFYHYTWTGRDRIDLVASTFLGDPAAWWKIMDINPEIIDPFNISIGTTIRIPRV
jgi:hypothetical protein